MITEKKKKKKVFAVVNLVIDLFHKTPDRKCLNLKSCIFRSSIFLLFDLRSRVLDAMMVIASGWFFFWTVGSIIRP